MRLRQLVAAQHASGQRLPVNSSKCVDWFSETSSWRVQLPVVFKHRQHYFAPANYGGVEEALMEALLFRDGEYQHAGLEPASAASVTRRQMAAGVTLPIFESVRARDGRMSIVGYWQETQANGTCKQRRVSRSVGIRTYSQALAEVQALVRQGLDSEARRFALW